MTSNNHNNKSWFNNNQFKSKINNLNCNNNNYSKISWSNL